MLPVIDELAKASTRSKERGRGEGEEVHFLRAAKGAREEGAFETRVDGSDYNYNATR